MGGAVWTESVRRFTQSAAPATTQLLERHLDADGSVTETYVTSVLAAASGGSKTGHSELGYGVDVWAEINWSVRNYGGLYYEYQMNASRHRWQKLGSGTVSSMMRENFVISPGGIPTGRSGSTYSPSSGSWYTLTSADSSWYAYISGGQLEYQGFTTVSYTGGTGSAMVTYRVS